MVSDSVLGVIVPFDDHEALVNAISVSLDKDWNQRAIRAYAEANTWDNRVATLVSEFRTLAQGARQ